MNRRLQTGFPARRQQPGEPLSQVPDASTGLRLQLVGEDASIARGPAGRGSLPAVLADARARLLAGDCGREEPRGESPEERGHAYRAH
jgi:hypothetical protein